MSDLAIIYMGGTFGCVGNPLAPMPETQFLPCLKANIPPIACFSAPSIKDSSAYTATDWLLLVQFIQQKSKQYQKFIIIHGTDTLSYASAVLSHFLQQQYHVILTGSQFPLLEATGNALRQPSDALNNLLFSIEKINQISKGVYLAFDNKIFNGHTALKIHTTDLNAFFGTLSPVKIPEPQIKITPQHIQKSKELNILNIMAQPTNIESINTTLQLLLQNPPHFLILQGFGTGNLHTNPKTIALLQKLRQQNCLPILNTQVTWGGIDQRYAISAWVKDADIVTANTHGHADLYAKVLKLYLQYDDINQWVEHWTHEKAL